MYSYLLINDLSAIYCEHQCNIYDSSTKLTSLATMYCKALLVVRHSFIAMHYTILCTRLVDIITAVKSMSI